jgi:hypothetical protein
MQVSSAEDTTRKENRFDQRKKELNLVAIPYMIRVRILKHTCDNVYPKIVSFQDRTSQEQGCIAAARKITAIVVAIQ